MRRKLLALLIFVVAGLGMMASAKETAKTKNLNLDLFVMSQCPYGVKAEKSILSALEMLGYPRNIRLNIYFICSKEDGRWTSLHGDAELEEDKRQLVIMKYFPDRYYDYLNSRLSHYYDEQWRKDCLVSNIPPDSVEVLLEKYGDDLLEKNASVALEKNITASPTLFINGVKVEHWGQDVKSIWALFAKSVGKLEMNKCYGDISCFDFDKKEFGACVKGENDEVGKCVYGEEAKKILAQHTTSTTEISTGEKPLRKPVSFEYTVPKYKLPDGAKLIEEQKFDFGVIPGRFGVRHIFVFKNNTGDTLKFKELGALSGGRAISYAINTINYDGKIQTLPPNKSYVVSVFVLPENLPENETAVAGTVVVMFEDKRYAQFIVTAEVKDWDLIKSLECPNFDFCDSSCAKTASSNQLTFQNISKDTIRVLIKDFPYDVYSDVTVPGKFVPPKGKFTINIIPLYDYKYAVYNQNPIVISILDFKKGTKKKAIEHRYTIPIRCER